MLALGVFGGKYMTDCREEFPAAWFAEAKLCHERHDSFLNFFEINASLPLAEWQKRGWIHPDDPGGGSSGTAATTWAGGPPTRTPGRLAGGRLCGGMWPRSGRTAWLGT